MLAVQGYDQAVRRYGAPVERIERYEVSPETMQYWRLVTRKRTAEVIMALRRPDGTFAVQTKSFYPEGVYRLMTGGVKDGEDLIEAVRRECWEETGQQVTVERFLATIESRFERDGDGEVIPFTSYLFLLSDDGGELQPADESEDISDYQFVTLAEVLAVADELSSLDPAWNDWGRFRAAPHRLLVELLSEGDA
ncbi:MAG: NUDIX hydrolase [Chloroflexi bacterium]|jgi:8-oxo-dGTP pyrophosphatase MutT (NUDIX family)|nr:NUDIX hydrolase [Chloroflexota bacterium]